jgi:transposase
MRSLSTYADHLMGWGQCVRDVLKQDPESGALFIFAGKRGTSLKILWWEKSGYSILYRRLARGIFHLPEAVSGDTSVLIDARELALILQGVEPATRKQRAKTLVKRAREKALRISEGATTESPA